MVVQECFLVLLGLSLLCHLVFSNELVCVFEFYVLWFEVIVTYILPVCTVLPGSDWKLPLLELFESIVSRICVIAFHMASWTLQGGYSTELAAFQVLLFIVVTWH